MSEKAAQEHVSDLSRINLSSIVASAAVPKGYQHRLEDMTDDLLDVEIEALEEEVTAGVHLLASRAAMGILAKAERGRRTPKAAVGRGNKLSGPPDNLPDKRTLSEERIVSEHLTDSDIVEIATDGKGWNTALKIARAKKKAASSPPKTPKHPAKFSDTILPVIADALPDSGIVLDPFAGTGRIHELATETRTTIGVEIEPEWADLHTDTRQGNALDLAAVGIVPESVDAIATSPTYGNRLADHHDAKDASQRRSYTHDLGHNLAPDNSGDLQWGDSYRLFHLNAYHEAVTALKPGGRMVVNISDHIRNGQPQGVHLWHSAALASLGLTWVSADPISTSRLRHGDNAEARVAEEWVLVFGKESPGGDA